MNEGVREGERERGKEVKWARMSERVRVNKLDTESGGNVKTKRNKGGT